MACSRREKYNYCGHHQCPYPLETETGNECVDIINDDDRGYCELGYDCLEKCRYSWGNKEKETIKELVNRLFKKELI